MLGNFLREYLVKTVNGATDHVPDTVRYNDTRRRPPEVVAVNQQINIGRALLGQLGVDADEDFAHVRPLWFDFRVHEGASQTRGLRQAVSDLAGPESCCGACCEKRGRVAA